MGVLLIAPGQGTGNSVAQNRSARTRRWGMRVRWGPGGGLEPWRWQPDVIGLSGNRLPAQLSEAAAVAAAALLGLWPLQLRAFRSCHCSRAVGLPPSSLRQPQVRDTVRLKAWGSQAAGWTGTSG